jgi:hypothetical protein
MARSTFEPTLAGAKDCPFCEHDFLFFQNGAVACDRCQCEGPFSQHFHDAENESDLEELKLEAVRLWNIRDCEAWDDHDAD